MKAKQILLYLVVTIAIYPYLYSQVPISDSTLYSDYVDINDAYYDSIIQDSGTAVLSGTGYKSFMRMKEYYYNDMLNSTSGDLNDLYDSKYLMLQNLSTYKSNYSNSSYQPNWKELGPFILPEKHIVGYNTAGIGRLSCIEIDYQSDDNMLIGSPGGGLYYSTDGGETFSNGGTDNITNSAGNTISNVIGISNAKIVHNSSGSTFWIISTGDRDNSFNYSTGVFRSNNNGTSWEDISSGLPNQFPSSYYRIYRMISSTTYLNTMYLATSKGIYKSTNVLTTYPTWSLVKEGDFFDIEFKPGNDTYIYASSNIPNYQGYVPGRDGIIYSSDGGVTWHEVEELGTPLSPVAYNKNNIARISIEVTNDNPNILYVTVNCHTAKTTGSPAYPEVNVNDLCKYNSQNSLGNKWDVKSPANIILSSGRQGFEVNNHNENEVLIANVQPYYSEDGGTNWVTIPYMHADIHDIKYSNDGEYIWFATDGGLYKYEIGTGGWYKSNNVGVAMYMKLAVDSKSKYIIGGGWDTGTNLYDFETKTWKGIAGGDSRGMTFNTQNDDLCYMSWSGEIYEHTISTEAHLKIQPPTFVINNRHSWFWDAVLYFCEDEEILYNTNYPSVQDPLGEITCLWRRKNGVWKDITTTAINEPGYYVFEVFQSPSSSDTMYIRLYKGGSPDLLYKSTNVRASTPTWTKVPISGIPNVPGGFSDLHVNQSNADAYWITFPGYKVSESKVYYYDGTQFVDHTGSLTALNPSVTQIIPHGDAAIIATSAGVFVKLNSSQNWELYQENLPFVPITEMLKNEALGKLYVSTMGRGVWEGDLPCLNGSQSLIIGNITGDVTWDTDKYVGGDVYIFDEKTLTINNNALISMGDGFKIVVEPGSRLIIDNATVTSGCGSYWKGIEVRGDKDSDQSYNASTELPNYQGEVKIINGGTIRNAEVAIRTIAIDENGNWDWDKTGGIIKLDGANLINNNYGVWIGPYDDNGKNNVSEIRDSYFEFDNNMLTGYTGYAHIGLYAVKGIGIYGNSLINTKIGPITTDKGRGIMAYLASFNIAPLCTTATTPCGGYQKNYFEGLYYGIYCSNNIENSNYVPIVDQAEFVDVYHGIHLLGTQTAEVTRCDYQISNSDPNANIEDDLTFPYGLYLNGSNAFKVEENYFTNYSDKMDLRGIVVNESDVRDNEIYKNVFYDLYVANQAQGNNRSDDDDFGLKYACNNMSDDDYDIYVRDEGIAQPQQISNAGGVPPFLPAGDIFTSCDQYGSFTNINNSSTELIDYYPRTGQAPVNQIYIPDCVSPDVDVKQAIAYGDNDICPSKIRIGDIIIDDLYTERGIAKVALNSSEIILSIWKDGGNANLEQEVETTQPWDVYVEFNSLTAESPYLSDEVLMATINNSAFTSLMIKLIMVANPQAAHSSEIMQAITDRLPAMPQTYIDAIIDGGNVESQLEVLEGNVAADHHLLHMISNDIKRAYRLDTENSLAQDSLIAFVSREGSLSSRYELAGIYLNNGQYSNMLSTLNAISTTFDLNDEQTATNTDWISYFTIAKDFDEEGVKYGILSEAEITSLEAMVSNANPGVSTSAVALLLANDPDYNYNEVVLPVIVLSARKAYNQPESDNFEENILKVFPNPSYDFITLAYSLDNQYQKVWFVLSDANGKQIMNQTLKGGNNEELINISQLKPNIYTLILYGDGELVTVKKITILK